ncbi:PIN/TRAM domain-containing protein [Anaerosinus massiliensis]|uniref:PIN/TRAM domain-containing protein n=1 Tax=Massilibacillus massiliensis TaxID=1806837 RepID=UPI000AB3A7DE|nr:PIN/TRAM domain-containing protein [Massilibacillus massiliensis]
MLDKVLRFVITILMAILGLVLMRFANPLLTLLISAEILKMGIFGMTMTNLLSVLLGGVIGGGIGFFISPYLIKNLLKLSLWVEQQLSKMPIHDVIAGAIGLAIGLIIANLLGSAFSPIPIVGSYIPVILSIILGYLGIHITIQKRDEIAGLFEFLPKLVREKTKDKEQSAEDNCQYKLLDTSVIIDGRIADICQSGFIEGTLLIPVFVLEELQHIADSSDLLKRNRGRRGLDVLNRIQKEFGMYVQIDSRDFDDISEVDSKLVKLGQLVHGKIITNDYNLNKVAELQGVPVLNINELSNAVKPVVIPGEDMVVTVVKDGKEFAQGVAYLDDGTMIVVEGGKKHMNETIEVVVTSVLQTAAGRMIFAKPKAAEKGA